MSDQAPNVETPAPADPQTAAPGTTDQPVIDWEKRYGDLRPEFDRTKQQLSQYEQLVNGIKSDDPDTRRQAAEALGLVFADEDIEEPVYTDPSDELRAELEQIKQALAQQQEREQAAQQQALVDQIDQQAQAKLAQLEGLDDEERDWVYSRALTNHPPTQEGLPDIEAAHQEFVAFQQRALSKWAQTKKTAHVSPVGAPGTQTPDLDDPEQRVAYMAERLRAMDD